MKYSKYPVLVDNAHTRYEFVSEGPAGSIKKVVLYEYISDNFFTNKFPAAVIYTEGSTRGRTRLYQMGITNNLEEIEQDFEIEGLIDEWEPFRKGRNYNAFLARRK